MATKENDTDNFWKGLVFAFATTAMAVFTVISILSGSWLMVVLDLVGVYVWGWLTYVEVYHNA